MATGGTRSTGKRLAISGALVLIAITALSSRPAQARSEVKPPPLVGAGHYGRLQLARVVDVGRLTRQTGTNEAPVPNHAVMRHAKSYAPPVSSTPRATLNAQPLVSQGSV